MLFFLSLSLRNVGQENGFLHSQKVLHFSAPLRVITTVNKHSIDFLKKYSNENKVVACSNVQNIHTYSHTKKLQSGNDVFYERGNYMDWTPNRIVALIIGIVFTLIGIAGFFVSSSMTVGSLMGFDVDIVHNLIHLVTGIIALATVFTGWFRRFNQIFGIIYLLLALAGLIYPGLYINHLLMGMTHVNAADHVLHIVVGAVAAGVGFFVHDYAPTRATPTV
jgi:hypothetical protein